MTASDSLRKKPRGPQARGVARREQLLAAADRLLQDRSIDSVSLAEVCTKADIPVASSYNFYANVNALFAQLNVDYSHQMADEMAQAVDPHASSNWAQVIEQLVDYFVRFYEEHKAFRQIRLSGKAPSEIRFTEERVRGVDYAPMLRALISAAYVMPELEDPDRPFLIMLDMLDGILCSEFMRVGELGAGIIEEAKRASVAYLKLYLPEYLPRGPREVAADSSVEKP